MTRKDYAFYIGRRVGESMLVAGMGVYAIHLAQEWGVIKPVSYRWLIVTYNDLLSHIGVGAPLRRMPQGAISAGWWTFPAVTGLLAYLFFGPKQRRPIYLKYPGTMYAFGGVRVDRNAGSRGGRIIGATGTGKTQICIGPRDHSIAVNECGIEKPTWKGSLAQKQFDAIRQEFLDQTEDAHRRIGQLIAERERLEFRLIPAQDALLTEMLNAVLEYQRANPNQPFSVDVFGNLSEEMSARFPSGQAIGTQDLLELFTWVRDAQRFGDIAKIPVLEGRVGGLITEYATLVEQDNALNAEINQLSYLIQVKRIDLQKFADTIKPQRYLVAPYGSLVLGAKGNEWQNVVPMLHHYRRDEDICLLQTRPADAPPNWTPPAMFNLISYETLPADTYAQIIQNTAAAVQKKKMEDLDPFFDNQARDVVGYGIKLMRAVRDAQKEKNIPEDKRCIPNLQLCCHIMTALDNYNRWLTEMGAAPIEKTIEVFEEVPDPTPEEPDRTIQKPVVKKQVIKAVLNTQAIRVARRQLETGYWALPEETQKSVMGNVRNYLVPFIEPEIADVFCGTNSFDLREIESGKVVCVAMPQKYAVQRRYVTTILKNIVFQLGRNRFDLRRDTKEFKHRNVVIVNSDEHHISAGAEDECVAIIREANFTLYAACQSVDELWKSYGGKDTATPILANLRNIWACQAGTDNCAADTAGVLGDEVAREVSFSSGKGSDSTSVSFKERPVVSKAKLKVLEPFYTYWIPAEGKWLYKKLLVMPVTPDAKTPPWWFGDWNFFVWIAAALCACGLPARWRFAGRSYRFHDPNSFIPPWKARAPARAQIRYLLGLDGTFITCAQMTRKEAIRRTLNYSERK